MCENHYIKWDKENDNMREEGDISLSEDDSIQVLPKNTIIILKERHIFT